MPQGQKSPFLYDSVSYLLICNVYNDSDHAECGGISETIPFSNFSAPKDFAIYIGQPTTGRGLRWVDTQL